MNAPISAGPVERNVLASAGPSENTFRQNASTSVQPQNNHVSAEADPVFVALPILTFLMIIMAVGLAVVTVICGVVYLFIHILAVGGQPKRRMPPTYSKNMGTRSSKAKRPLSPAKKMLLIYLLAQVVLIPFYCIVGALLYSMGAMDPEPESNPRHRKVIRSDDL